MSLLSARRCTPLLSPLLARMSSTSTPTTYTMRPSPPKSHLHQPIPDSHFPTGYLLSGVHVGVKSSPSPSSNPNPKPDVGVILSTSPRETTAAACFTLNAFRAAPVLVSEEVLVRNGGRARAVVVNSGCANAVTGKRGMEDAWAMVEAGDKVLRSVTSSSSTSNPNANANVNETLVMSTGVIGQTLPISKILSGISSTTNSTSLGSSFAHYEAAARAFMTTDTFPKLRARVFTINGREYRMAGMDKGAGMIHPDMGPPSAAAASVGGKRELHATLLGLILTDAAVSSRSLQNALTYAVSRSFNSISVDGDMSTNDTIVVLANGAAAGDATEGNDGAAVIDEETDPAAYTVFRDELTTFAIELAQLVVRDGEGATKFVTVTVEGAATYADAHAIASRISTSALVKTALYGEDANWGRILATSGSLQHPTLSTPLLPHLLSVSFIPTDGSAPLPLLTRGEPEKVDEVRAKAILEKEDLEVKVDVGVGGESARYWTCDFSYEYVRINGDYRS